MKNQIVSPRALQPSCQIKGLSTLRRLLLFGCGLLLASTRDSPPLFADSGPAPIKLCVQLPTADQRLPLLLVCEASIEASQAKELAQVLLFDLSHNGRSYCSLEEIHDQQKLQQLKGQGAQSHALRERLLHERGAHGLLFLQLDPGRATIHLFSDHGASHKQTPTVPLQGHLPTDRQPLHQLSDAVYEELFGEKGFATSHLLYAVHSIAKEGTAALSQIWECDWDGANGHPLTSEEAGYCMSPTYLPPEGGHASSAFLYVSYLKGQPKIYLCSRHEQVGKEFLGLGGNQLMPTINRQRTHMAFISDVMGNPDLFIAPLLHSKGKQGHPQQLFWAPHATQASPSFHPQATHIAFVSNRDGTARIYAMELPKETTPTPKREARLISRCCRGNTAPSWSPDGSKIAYCALTDGVHQIWVYDIERDCEVQLTDSAGHKENPSWAPNSQLLVYNTVEGTEGGGGLYLLEWESRQITPLPHQKSHCRFPSWEPMAPH